MCMSACSICQVSDVNVSECLSDFGHCLFLLYIPIAWEILQEYFKFRYGSIGDIYHMSVYFSSVYYSGFTAEGTLLAYV